MSVQPLPPNLDSASELILSQIMPEVALSVRVAHAAYTVKTGSYFHVISGYRSLAQQAELYRIGRRGVAGEKTVTDAPAGYSNHNTGMAVDVVPNTLIETSNGLRIPVTITKGFIPDWNTAHPDWAALVIAMKGAGLAWGGDWKNFKGDLDHFQYLSSPPMPSVQDREFLSSGAGGLLKVWDYYRNIQTTKV